MRKADRETESRKLIGEKLREARMADNSPMTEADAEYYRILAEARATHASKENIRKSAKKHAFTSAAAILLILAVAGGSFILGMQSDVRASADPDDKRKVVQQGDNIVIGSGVSEDDEYTGSKIITFNSKAKVPLWGIEIISAMEKHDFNFTRIKIVETKDGLIDNYTIYFDNTITELVISEKINSSNEKTVMDLKDVEKTIEINEHIIYECEFNDGKMFLFEENQSALMLYIDNDISENEIEAILKDLVN